MGAINAMSVQLPAKRVESSPDSVDSKRERKDEKRVMRLVPPPGANRWRGPSPRGEPERPTEAEGTDGRVMTPNPPEIRKAETAEERERVFRFRYQVYVEEMGKRSSAADHTRRILFDDLDKTGVILYAEDDAGRIVGTTRLNIMRPQDVPEHLKMIFALHRFEAFEGCVISISSRAVVASEWRGTPLMSHMVIALYHVMKKYGVHFDFCHCRPSLVRHYEAFGARRYTDNFVDPDAGYQVPLVTVLNDVGYFKRVNPVVYGLSRRYQNDQRSVRWFYDNLGEQTAQFVSRYVSEEGFRRFLEQTRLEREVPLFQGLSTREVERFLEASTILRCKTGDLIVRQDDPGGELFVLLSGFAEVRREGAAGKQRVATLTQGDVFGEMGFVRKRPRTATVEALSEARVLVLSSNFFHRVMRSMPEVTARVLFNLSRTLCDRLDQTTRNWVGSREAVGAA